MTPAGSVPAQLRALCEAATEFAPGYLVTRDGRVYSSGTNWRGYGVRELAQHPNSHGYMRVRCGVLDRRRFPAEVVRRSFFVHKLVADAYLPPPVAGQQLRHLNVRDDLTEDREDVCPECDGDGYLDIVDDWGGVVDPRPCPGCVGAHDPWTMEE